MSTNPAPPPERPSSEINRRWALVAIVVVVLLLVGAVGVYAVLPRGAGSAGGSPSDLSPYDQLRAQIGPNGEVTKEMALEAFSLAIAPLPGVTVPTGAPPNADQQGDATFAIEWILPYLDQLTADQLAVVDGLMTPDPSAPSFTPAAAAPRVVFADSTTASQYLDMAEKYETEEAGLLGRQLTSKVTLMVDSTQLSEHPEWLAYSIPNADSSVCIIHVEPLLQSGGNSAQETATMAHEMFHCFQFDWARQHGFQMTKDNMAGWISEGQAEWVGETLGGPSTTGDYWWKIYLTSYHDSLFKRDYDAVGFYQHMAEEGIDPWHQFDAMLSAYTNGSDASAFAAASATDDSFLNTWASGIFQQLELGRDWDAASPWTQVSTDKKPVTVGNGGNEYEEAGQVGNELVKVNVTADILQVEGHGHVRIHAGSVPEMPNDDRWLCFDQKECQCPPGQIYEGPVLEDVEGDRTADIALTGGLDGASVSLFGHDLIKDYCKERPSQQPDQCSVTCPRSNGDPHLRTVNRYVYDFQAAGEFTLLRSPNSSIDIQVRQEPWVTANFGAVSINSAIAARANGHKVSVYATDSGLQLHVDGQQVDAASAPDLGAGSAIKPIKNGIEVDFPDGTVLWTLSVGRWGINAVIQASDALKADGRGLMGPITPGGLGVPALSDGTQLPAAPDFETRHNIVYGQFADAWRVTDETTLFDYDAGKSTETYTDRTFPPLQQDQAVSNAISSPDPQTEAAAQATCSGITDADLLSDCTFDVTVTGDGGFAQQYAIEQDFYDNGVAPQTAPPASPGGATGVLKIADLQDLDGSAVGPDNTLYASITDSTGAPTLLAVDTTTAAVKTQAPLRVANGIHFDADSVWISGESADSSGSYCTVTRYDPSTLAKQGDYPIPCTNGAPPTLVGMGDAVWFVDTSKTDPNTGAGTALTRIDPGTNAPGTSVPLPEADGCCQGSNGAIFCYCGNSDEWRLTNNDSAFVDMGKYQSVLPAGAGFWTLQGTNLLYINNPGGPSVTIPLTDVNVGDALVGGDANAAYLEGEPPDNPLLYQPADGSPPTQIAKAPTVGTGIDETILDYSANNPWFATPTGYLHLWVFKDDPSHPLGLWEQWAPLP